MPDPHRRCAVRALARFSAPACAVACLLASPRAYADPMFDLRGGYPRVLGSEYRGSTYEGSFMFGLRFGASLSDGPGSRGWLLFGFDRYFLTNSVPGPSSNSDGSIRAGVANFPFYAYYSPGWRERGKAFDLMLGGSLGFAARTFENVDGAALALVASASVMGAIYPSESSQFFVAPEVELSHVSEGGGSHVGAVNLVTFGIRIGVGGAEPREFSEEPWNPAPPPPEPAPGLPPG